MAITAPVGLSGESANAGGDKTSGVGAREKVPGHTASPVPKRAGFFFDFRSAYGVVPNGHSIS
jgi:hypothetical protein